MSVADGTILDDGSYDAIVVDATPVGDGSVSFDLTIVSGPAHGEVVAVRATEVPGDPLGLLGVPATLVVSDGRPSVTFEP